MYTNYDEDDPEMRMTSQERRVRFEREFADALERRNNPRAFNPVDAGLTGIQEERFKYEQAGRQRYRDLFEDQRDAALKDVLHSLDKGTQQELWFARGWLDEREKQR